MVGTYQFCQLLTLTLVVPAFCARGSLGLSIFGGDENPYPVVAGLASGTQQSGGQHSDAETGPNASGNGEDVERVHLNPDGSISFDCPKSICGLKYFFGRGNFSVTKKTQPPSETPATTSNTIPTPKQDPNKTVKAKGLLARGSENDGPEVARQGLRLADLSHVTDMSWLGVDKSAHQLAFLKNNTCGGLYIGYSQLPPAKADPTCSISNLDEHAFYIKRLDSQRIRRGKMALAIGVGSALSLKSRIWRRNLMQSTSLRFIVYLTQTFGRLKPNVLKTNPAAVINTILRQRKDLLYPVMDLVLYGKACRLIQSYPERLLQGHPRHVHPDHPAYLEMPIFLHLRKVGVEVALPKNAPTVFQPRIYDGNTPVERSSPASGISRNPISSLFSNIFRRLKGTRRLVVNVRDFMTEKNRSFGVPGGPSRASLDKGRDATRSPESARIKTSESDEKIKPPGRPTTGRRRPPLPAVEEWKKHTYRSWHSLWILTLLLYHSADMWGWTQHHEASTFVFAPWKITQVDVMRTTEAAPMRWRNLSPRFRLDRTDAAKPTPLVRENSAASDPSTSTRTPGAGTDSTDFHLTTSATPHNDSQADASDRTHNEILPPEGCPRHLTDMHFFKKLGVPEGRLRFQGPSGSVKPADSLDAEDGTWTPPILGSEVMCPPKVHPDTCGLTASYNRAYDTPWIWRLERDDSHMGKDKDASLDYADVVWIFRGTYVSKLWLLNGITVAVPYKVLSRRGQFHYGIAYLFDKAVRPLLDHELARLTHRLAERKTPLVYVFSGHSLGGSLAQMAAWYFAKRAKALVKKEMLQLRTVGFASPPWGDTNAYEEYMASGVKAQEVNMDIDPVPVMLGEEALTKLSSEKPFSMKVHINDMDKVEVASSIPRAPPFSGRFWTRSTYRPAPLWKRLAATALSLEDVDMVLLDPLISHFTAYTTSLTIMAGLLEEASFGSGVAAPLARNIHFMFGHPWNVALKEAHEMLAPVLRRVEADRVAEEHI